jgi:hypothetical protein
MNHVKWYRHSLFGIQVFEEGFFLIGQLPPEVTHIVRLATIAGMGLCLEAIRLGVLG